MQEQQFVVAVCACTAAVVIVTLLCPGSAAATVPEEEPLIDQIAMESIDSFSPAQNFQVAAVPPPVSYTGFKINPNCKCGKSPYTMNDNEGNPHPWTAAIFYRNPAASSTPPSSDSGTSMLLFCTGSLINDRYILTASRCVQGLNASDLQVWLSEKGIWSDQQVALRSFGGRQYETNTSLKKSNVEKVIIHPGFNPSNLNHEIALLRLTDPVKLTRKRRDGSSRRRAKKRRFFTTPICLPKSNLITWMMQGDEKVGKQSNDSSSPYVEKLKGTVVSWDKKGRTSYSLVQSQVPFVSGIEKCVEMTNRTAKLTENMLCAGRMEEGVKESCSMDTGSPLLIYEGGEPNQQKKRVRVSSASGDEGKGQYTQVGVSSWLYGCTNLQNVNTLYDVIFPNNTAKPQVPGVYARVETYRDWITHNTLDAVWCA